MTLYSGQFMSFFWNSNQMNDAESDIFRGHTSWMFVIHNCKSVLRVAIQPCNRRCAHIIYQENYSLFKISMLSMYTHISMMDISWIMAVTKINKYSNDEPKKSRALTDIISLPFPSSVNNKVIEVKTLFHPQNIE